MTFKPFDPADFDAFAGAECFADGSGPFTLELGSYSVVLAAGETPRLGFYAESGEAAEWASPLLVDAAGKPNLPLAFNAACALAARADSLGLTLVAGFTVEVSAPYA